MCMVPRSEHRALQHELACVKAERDRLSAMLTETHTTEWRVTKDGKRRYRRHASKVLVNAWITESEPLQ